MSRIAQSCGNSTKFSFIICIMTWKIPNFGERLFVTWIGRFCLPFTTNRSPESVAKTRRIPRDELTRTMTAISEQSGKICYFNSECFLNPDDVDYFMWADSISSWKTVHFAQIRFPEVDKPWKVSATLLLSELSLLQDADIFNSHHRKSLTARLLRTENLRKKHHNVQPKEGLVSTFCTILLNIDSLNWVTALQQAKSACKSKLRFQWSIENFRKSQTLNDWSSYQKHLHAI